MAPRQEALLDDSAPARPEVVIVNDGVSIRIEGTHRLVLVHGVVFAHYDVSDRAVEGWTPPSITALPLSDQAPARGAVVASESSVEPASCRVDATRSKDVALPDIEPLPVSFDADPLDRSLDRLLAAMGQLDDAAPLFATADSLPGAGVLLAVPALVASGLLSVARQVYGSIGPAFYGLRTTLVAYVLLVLLRIPRPEVLKEYAPAGLGRVIGLDRMPEVKTLRRKLARASMKRGHELGRQLAEHRIAARGLTIT